MKNLNIIWNILITNFDITSTYIRYSSKSDLLSKLQSSGAAHFSIVANSFAYFICHKNIASSVTLDITTIRNDQNIKDFVRYLNHLKLPKLAKPDPQAPQFIVIRSLPHKIATNAVILKKVISYLDKKSVHNLRESSAFCKLKIDLL